MSSRAPTDDPGDADLRVGAAASSAAGVPGVLHGLAHAKTHLGLRRGARLLLKVNQSEGFDCPGCAWPEGDHRSTFEFCENGVKAIAEEGTRRRIGVDFFDSHTIADLRGRSDHWLGQQGRLTVPVYKAPDDDRYRKVSWDDAFGLVAAAIDDLDDPNEAAFYTSGRTSNEAAFVYQLMARTLGTNNLPDCSNMCHESSGVALTDTIGIGKGSVSLDDIHGAEVIVVVGQNPGTNHPRMLTALERAHDNGATIVSINPMPEAGLIRFKNPQRVSGVVGSGTPLADQFLQIRVGGDLALFSLVNRSLVARGAVDRDFVDRYCDGEDALTAHLAELDTEELTEATGLQAREIDDFVDLLATHERIIVCWAMGLTQHKAAVPTIREVVNTLLLRGSIGKPGAGVCPVRGHSNVQGDRTMGIHEKPSDAFLDALGAEFGFEPPREPGVDVVDAIRAMRNGDVRVFVGLGGNFVSAAPDTDATIEALSACRLTVQISTKLNRSHTVVGDAALIIPCLGRTEIDRTGGREQFVTVEDSMSSVHASRGAVEPAQDDLRSEVAIVTGIAERLRHPGTAAIDWQTLRGDYATIRDHIAQVVPGFERFNERALDGFTLPHPPRDSRSFDTPTGRAQLTVNVAEPIRIPEGRLLLQTVRSHDQYNTTIYGLDDRYRGITGGRRVVFCNRDDLAELGVADGAMVDLVSEWRDGERRAPAFRVVEYDIARRTCAAYFPEANVLVPLDSVADESNTPTSKAIVVRLDPSSG